jgi:beta-mannanase
VAAWQHVHGVVTAAGATNVTWVWNPNVPYWGSVPLAGLYPGAGYVDAVALDGYNWGTSASWSSWVSPSQLFGDGLSQLRTLAPGKQILIAETSSAEQGGNKADWITSLFSYLAAQPDITAVTWFHYNKETDWRINSSTASANAFKQALAARG